MNATYEAAYVMCQAIKQFYSLTGHFIQFVYCNLRICL